MVHGRSADAEGLRQTIEIGIGHAATLRGGLPQCRRGSCQRPIGLQPVDGRKLSVGGADRPTQVGLLGVDEPVETCPDITADALRFELENARDSPPPARTGVQSRPAP